MSGTRLASQNLQNLYLSNLNTPNMHKILTLLLFLSTTALLAQPANDERADAIEIRQSLDGVCFPVTGTTQGATGAKADSLIVERDSCGRAANDVWYTFTSPDTADYRFSVTRTGGDDNLYVEVIADRNGREIIEYCLMTFEDEDTIQSRELIELPGGRELTIRVYAGTDTGAIDYRLCMERIELLRIAEGNGCVTAAPVIFDGTGQPGEFIAVRDSTGIIASIENTQPLGEVTVSFFDYNGPPRETEDGAIYLNRSISIEPENQPGDTVAVRLWLPEDDIFAVLDTGVISDDGELAITKVPSSTCSANFPGGGEPVDFVRTGTFQLASYIEVRVDGFSEFFIHPADQQLSSIKDNRVAARPWGIAPNPVTDGRLTLTAPENLRSTPATVEVYTLTGQRLETYRLPAGATRYLDASAWPRGVYTLVITAGEERVAARVMR